MLNKKKNNKGFTLVELLVVIAIIGILAVVAVPALFKNIEKGKVAELESDISAIRSASLSFYAENSRYPGVTDLLEGTSSNANTTDANDIKNEIESLGNPFKSVYAISGTEPGKALLTIDLSGTGAVKLSKDAAEKLVNDLGKVLMIQVNNSKYTKSGYTINETTGAENIPQAQATGDLNDFKTTAADNSQVSKIIIELMDGENQ